MKPGRWLIWTGLIGLLLIGLGAFLVSQTPKTETPTQTNQEQEKSLRGFSLSPKSYEAADFSAFFPEISKHGNIISWAGQYSDLTKTNGNAAKTVITQGKKYNMTPVIITGPVKGEVFDGVFQSGMKEAVINFVKENDVPYLGLGNEIDQEYYQSPGRFETLLTYLEGLASDVKKESPTTKTFTVFQHERTIGLRGGLFGGTNDRSKSILNKISELKNFDLVAFTTYPGLIYKSPSDIPEEYYVDIQNFTTKPVAFTEVGWFRVGPKGWESSEAEQVKFIQRFDELTKRLEPRLVTWPFYYDQKVAEPFATMGLLQTNQTSSSALSAWDAYSKL